MTSKIEKIITNVDSPTFECDYDTFCMEIDHWHPTNTRWNRFKAWLGLGKKPELRRVSVGQLVEPQLIFSNLPKVIYYGEEEK